MFRWLWAVRRGEFGTEFCFQRGPVGLDKRIESNAGAAVAKGFDLQSQWQVTKAFDLELSVGYTDAKFTRTAG